MIASKRKDRTCLDVNDGLYTNKLYPDICSEELVLEFSKGRGNNFGFFPEQLVVEGAYQGELLGFMEIHLILLTVKNS